MGKPVLDSMTRGPSIDLDRITEPGDSRSIAKDNGPSQATSLMVANMLRQGVSPHSICRKIGVSIRLYNAWLDKDPAESTRLERIFQSTVGDAIAEVSGKAFNRIMMRIEDTNDPKGVDDSKWLLERVNPEGFSTKQKIEVGGPDGGPLQVATLSRTELLVQLKKMTEENEAILTDAVEVENDE